MLIFLEGLKSVPGSIDDEVGNLKVTIDNVADLEIIVIITERVDECFGNFQPTLNDRNYGGDDSRDPGEPCRT